jgi:UDP-N-acetylglucosamine 2-epimerase (hydrolysing)
MLNKEPRKIMFLTGTRADFGKLKPLMLKMQEDNSFETHVFVTGMHMLSRYGSTWDEVRKAGIKNIYRFVNQNSSDSLDHVLAKTITGLSDYVKELGPDLIVVHGDRTEAMAGAIVGVFNNILVAHIEGGEVSGTIDEVIRHAVSKLSHVHFVANDVARKRLRQLGELENNIYIIGSPDIDVMNSRQLPDISEVRKYYNFDFLDYAILIFHPVTTETSDLRRQTRMLVNHVLEADMNYVVIYPNNDPGNEIIFEEYVRFENKERIKIYPSMRFEYFLTLLKNSKFIIGNSSVGIREAPHFGVPAINIGSRQNNRVKTDLVLNAGFNDEDLRSSFGKVLKLSRSPVTLFGDGHSAKHFYAIVKETSFWSKEIQKFFTDRFLDLDSICKEAESE